MTTDTAALVASVTGYARRMHAVIGAGHQVASPLGAWLLLALCGPATSGADRAQLAEVLGCDVPTAAQAAADLLASPHPLVSAAAAAWITPGSARADAIGRWQAGLPDSVPTGEVPGQAQLDSWARDHSFGLIDRFPLTVDPAVYLVLATVLATRVSWEVPFDLAPASALGAASPWSERLGQVLRTPVGRHGEHPGHTQFIATTPEAGEVAVHMATASDGLLVVSVAAVAAEPAQVLAAAYRIGCAHALGHPDPKRPLAQLPLGEGPLWLLREETTPDGNADLCTAVLPAWSARSQHALEDPALGFGAAVRALAGPDPWRAAQAAMAQYSRTGFKAAAVTTVMAAMSMRLPRPGTRRVAELRFGHPYAVVAITLDQRAEAGADMRIGPWHGVPVFSAWVAEPQDAADQPNDSAGTP